MQSCKKNVYLLSSLVRFGVGKGNLSTSVLYIRHKLISSAREPTSSLGSSDSQPVTLKQKNKQKGHHQRSRQYQAVVASFAVYIATIIARRNQDFNSRNTNNIHLSYKLYANAVCNHLVFSQPYLHGVLRG